MKSLSSNNTMKIALLGSLIVAIILIAGTYLAGRTAKSDAETAVRNVSLLYLDELAGRREQVVSSTLNGYIKNMDVALGLMEKEDYASIGALQAYQVRMKQLYGLEKFAFVDENGLIYTSRGTRTDIDQYAFDYLTLSEPEISLKKTRGESKKAVIATPVDSLPFENTHLLVCFMEISMDKLIESVSLQSNSNSTTFCNLYTSEGDTLSNAVLGGLANGDNLLAAMQEAQFEAGYSIGKMTEDFHTGRKGIVSFTFNGIKETLCYVPVHGTSWMLTYLIRESVISEQISAISDGIVARGLMQSLLTALVLIIIFGLMISQMKKASKLAMERETSELMQQELEERLALQDELLEQEKVRKRQDSMITALASDYRSVYYVNLDSGKSLCYRHGADESDPSEEGGSFDFSSVFYAYAEKYVSEEYRPAFLDFIKIENIRTGLKNDPIIACRYLVNKNGIESYEMLRMADVENTDSSGQQEIKAVGVGFTDIDAEMRDSLSKNQALSDALKAAEEASRAKTVFLSNMSHEIRTPMNAIIGLDSLALNEEGLSPSTKDYLEKIGSSAQHLLSLINDILDMSRIESGRMAMRHEEFAFSKLLEQINIIFSGQCQEKGLEYDCHINGQLNDYFIGDSTKLRQVLINILGNAVKFTDEGGKVEFIVEKTAAFDNKSTLRFTIRDSGIGMSKDFIPRIFDAFSQENGGNTNRYGSSGLGMAITKNIVEMMNGHIEVESEKGAGTTFIVTVTLQNSDRQESGDPEVEICPQDMSVLIIDDDPVACDHASLVLSQAGIASETALSGKEAVSMVKLHHARQKPYNLIIVDLKMPEMDGVETTRQIRSIIGEESAIIILTAYHWDDILEEATAAGVDSFIAKPLFTGSLLDEFKSTLKRKNRTFGAKKKAELKGRRVLMAEDMAINAQIMMKILEMRGIEADLAENGRIAVDLFSSKPEGYYDAILMDMRMPEMDGLTATSTIRGLSRADAKTIPIIALTANAFDEDVQRSLQAGLNAHLSKPVQPDVLFETLENLI